MNELRWAVQDGKVIQLQHPVQLRIMELAKTIDIRTLSLRQIAKICGINNAQSVKYHISQIAKSGYDFSVLAVEGLEQGSNND